MARKINSRYRWHLARLKLSDALAGVALVVALSSAWISYQSLSSTKHQVQLSDLQIRPYVRYKPVFNQVGEDLLTTMISENLSSIPAKVIYSELRTWVDATSSGAFLFNRTGDVLYEHHNGSSDLPQMPKEIAHSAINGKAQVMVGTCVVYSSLSPSDSRRWEAKALYSYEPHQDLPSVQYFNEEAVAEGIDRCDSSNLRSQWMGVREQPKPNSTTAGKP